MPEEIAPIIPILIGLAIVLVVLAVIGAGLGWLVAHPVVVLVVVGFIGFLVWRGAHRNRV